MLPHPLLRLCSLAAAVALIAAAGGVATAGPGGGERSLEPTAQLAADGGTSAPAPATGGGMAAPAPAEPVPSTPEPMSPAPEQAPAAAPPEETVTGAAPAPTDGAPADPLEGEGTATPVDPEQPEQPEPVEAESLEPPTSEEALGADGSPLVPAEMLGVEIEDAADSPLIDISPAHVAAEPLRSQPELAAAPAQEETPNDDRNGDDEDPDGDDEVIIPVPIDPDDDDANGQDPTQVPAAPAPVARERGPGLPSTGLELLGPVSSALLLLLAGAALRLAVVPARPPAQPA